MKQIRLLIFGSRPPLDIRNNIIRSPRWHARLALSMAFDIEMFANSLHPPISPSQIFFISGGAEGPDTVAEHVRWAWKADGEVYPANWDAHDKAAGMIRNQQMINEGRPTHALMYWDGKSAGTADMKLRLEKVGIEVLDPCKDRDYRLGV